MFRRKGLAMNAAVAAAALSALACGSQVRASGVDASAGAAGALASATTPTSSATSASNTLTPFSLDSNASTGTSTNVSDQPVMLQAEGGNTAAPAKPLTSVLNYTPIGKPIGDSGISISGYGEGSWTYAAPPSEHLIVGRAYDFEPQSIILDAVDLEIQRGIDTTQNHFDFGFNIEGQYGADPTLNHANGLTFYSPSKILGAYTSSGTRQPKNQFDLLQGFIDFAIPIGNGLGITIGKFDTLIGYEVTDGPLNPLYSHSYLYTQAPITHTGGLAYYNLTKEISITGGATRGWDQSLKDNNGSWDVTGQLKYSKDKINAYLNAISGNESPDVPAGLRGSDGWRTLIDGIVAYNYSDNLILTVNGDYAWQAERDNGGTAQWYGVAAYASYTLSSQFTLNFRGEWFDDQDGASPVTFAGIPNTYYEVTAGLKFTPFPNNTVLSNLVLRPEVRYDYADHPVFGASGGERNQLTAAVEGYFTF